MILSFSSNIGFGVMGSYSMPQSHFSESAKNGSGVDFFISFRILGRMDLSTSGGYYSYKVKNLEEEDLKWIFVPFEVNFLYVFPIVEEFMLLGGGGVGSYMVDNPSILFSEGEQEYNMGVSVGGGFQIELNRFAIRILAKGIEILRRGSNFKTFDIKAGVLLPLFVK
jgi:opacity protein-like surface antigen